MPYLAGADRHFRRSLQTAQGKTMSKIFDFMLAVTGIMFLSLISILCFLGILELLKTTLIP